MGGLFKSPPQPKPVRMPDPEDPEVDAAEDRTRRLAMARSGRASTVLSNPTGGSGGNQSYKNSLLGQS